MFSTGQLIFGILFFIVFVIVIAYQYRKDLPLHKRYYKGTVWILIAFIGFIGLIATVKFMFM
jgi:cbb3-type cytochrome oxidase subunit 3